MVSRAVTSPCTYPHSCACQQPAHSRGHRHTCSCLVCWHSVAHSDRCPAWSTHPSLKTQRCVRALFAGPLAWLIVREGHTKSHWAWRCKRNKYLNNPGRLWKHSPTKSLQVVTSHLWRSWQQIRPCWQNHLKRISSTAGWSLFWCHLVCRSHRSGLAEGCFQSSHHAPPGSHRHNCHVSQSAVKWRGDQSWTKAAYLNKSVFSYLKRLKGKADVVALSYRNLPHAHFVRPVVIGVVGGLDLATVLFHLAATDCCIQ